MTLAGLLRSTWSSSAFVWQPCASRVHGCASVRSKRLLRLDMCWHPGEWNGELVQRRKREPVDSRTASMGREEAARAARHWCNMQHHLRHAHGPKQARARALSPCPWQQRPLQQERLSKQCNFKLSSTLRTPTVYPPPCSEKGGAPHMQLHVQPVTERPSPCRVTLSRIIVSHHTAPYSFKHGLAALVASQQKQHGPQSHHKPSLCLKKTIARDGGQHCPDPLGR